MLVCYLYIIVYVCNIYIYIFIHPETTQPHHKFFNHVCVITWLTMKFQIES